MIWHSIFGFPRVQSYNATNLHAGEVCWLFIGPFSYTGCLTKKLPSLCYSILQIKASNKSSLSRQLNHSYQEKKTLRNIQQSGFAGDHHPTTNQSILNLKYGKTDGTAYRFHSPGIPGVSPFKQKFDELAGVQMLDSKAKKVIYKGDWEIVKSDWVIVKVIGHKRQVYKRAGVFG